MIVFLISRLSFQPKYKIVYSVQNEGMSKIFPKDMNEYIWNTNIYNEFADVLQGCYHGLDDNRNNDSITPKALLFLMGYLNWT